MGPAILITPVIEENAEAVHGYFPKDNWYSYYDGKIEHKDDEAGSWKYLCAPFDVIPIHIRGGFVIPTQEPANNTVYSRKNPFGLIVALDWDNEAKGDLFYDDGDTNKYEEDNKYYYSTFAVYSNTLKMEIEHNEYTDMSSLRLDTIRILVEQNAELSFTLNGNPVAEYNIQRQTNQIILKNLSLPMDKSFELKWTNYRADLVGETRIDCSVENQNIVEMECLKKNCAFDSQASGRVPKCFIPKGSGGYSIKSATDNHFELSRADEFSLYGSEIENLVIDTSYGKIDDAFDLVRIKVKSYLFSINSAKYNLNEFKYS